MPLRSDYLDAIAGARTPSSGPLVVPWPMPADLGGKVSFSTFEEWRSFVLALSPRAGVRPYFSRCRTRLQHAVSRVLTAGLGRLMLRRGLPQLMVHLSRSAPR